MNNCICNQLWQNLYDEQPCCTKLLLRTAATSNILTVTFAVRVCLVPVKEILKLALYCVPCAYANMHGRVWWSTYIRIELQSRTVPGLKPDAWSLSGLNCRLRAGQLVSSRFLKVKRSGKVRSAEVLVTGCAPAAAPLPWLASPSQFLALLC
jgi:hypothetical protein